MTYYKATHLDGTDFYSGTVDYAAALKSGKRVRVNTPTRESYACCTPDVLHAANVPTETLIGGSWPCRLFEVEGKPVASERHKYGFRQLRVVREVDAHLALGPQGREVAALIERAGSLTGDEASRLAPAWDDAASSAARDAAWSAAWSAARDAAWSAAFSAAWSAARDAARALVVRDLIGWHGFEQHHYDTLTRPWREVLGPVHPEDAAVSA